MTAPSLQQYKCLYSLRGSGPPLLQSSTEHVELHHVTEMCTICHKRLHQILLNSSLSFSFLKGIITQSDAICCLFLSEAARFIRPSHTLFSASAQSVFSLVFFNTSFWKAATKCWVFCPHSKSVWYSLLYRWQNLSIQQLQLSWGFNSKPMAPKTQETNCNERPTIHLSVL